MVVSQTDVLSFQKVQCVLQRNGFINDGIEFRGWKRLEEKSFAMVGLTAFATFIKG